MKRILVMDDDDQLRAMLQLLLEKNGYEVLSAENGKIGLKLFYEKGADLIITDLIMPEKEGLETIIELHQNVPGLKIIAISGGGRIRPEGYLKLSESLGADRSFKKPFNNKELLSAVSELLA
jgi:two-component system cell cycle response regulator CpdR